MRIFVLYDNLARPPLCEGWGLSALIEVGARRLLFDTGADRIVLEHNVEALGVDLSTLTDVFLSHPHCDHIGGLSYVLQKARQVRLWIPKGMEGHLRLRARDVKAGRVVVRGPCSLGGDLLSTGSMGRKVKEHGLIIASPEGPVLVTGCAHPGIDRMATRATRLMGHDLSLVVGGFHLGGESPERVSAVVDRLVGATRSVAPGHCTGVEATAALLARFPSGITLEVGKTIRMPDSPSP